MRKKRYDIKLNNIQHEKLDSSIKNWLNEHNIRCYSWYYKPKMGSFLSFKYEEDAVAFKLDYM